MVIGYMVIGYMAIGYGYWQLTSGYMDISYMGIGYWYMAMVIGYMIRLDLAFFEFGVRTSFMWVWMFGFEVFQVYGQGFSSMIWFLGSWIFEVKHGLYLCKILELKIKIYN